jgi:hypothetical protein
VLPPVLLRSETTTLQRLAAVPGGYGVATMNGLLATVLADGIYIGGGVLLAILIILVVLLLLRRGV